MRVCCACVVGMRVLPCCVCCECVSTVSVVGMRVLCVCVCVCAVLSYGPLRRSVVVVAAAAARRAGARVGAPHRRVSGRAAAPRGVRARPAHRHSCTAPA